MDKTAIILGATGLTGSILLDKLLRDKRYAKVKLFSRKNSKKDHPKIIEKVGNILDLGNFKDDFIADEVYVCIGTTSKKTPDKALYRKIDFGIPVTAAQICKANNIDTIIVISAEGANPKSAIFYSKTKGEMEEAVLNEKIPNTYILRPALISGNRKEYRSGEKIGIKITKALQFLLVGGLRKYRVIEAEIIAQAMINLANSKVNMQMIPSNKIQEIGS